MDLELYNYLQEIKMYKPLSRKEQQNLIIKIKNNNDQEAYLKLYYSNLKMVVSVAKRFFNCNSCFSKMDIIQEGNIGLMKAIVSYDLKYINKIKFSTYAFDYIKAYIDRIIKNNGYTIRIPIHKYYELDKYKIVYDKLCHKLKRIPTLEELALELNMSKENILILERITNFDIESLNNKVSLDDDTEFIDLLFEDENVLNNIVNNEQKEFFEKEIFSKLTKKQYEIIYYLYGLDGNIERGYEEVAKILNYPDRRYVYEHEKRALKKIKNLLEQYNLEDYGGNYVK